MRKKALNSGEATIKCLLSGVCISELEMGGKG